MLDTGYGRCYIILNQIKGSSKTQVLHPGRQETDPWAYNRQDDASGIRFKVERETFIVTKVMIRVFFYSFYHDESSYTETSPEGG